MLDEKEIMLIDDDEIVNFYNQDLLKEYDSFHSISIYNNPDTALEELKNRIQENKPLPKYLLVDINMPEIEGFDFIDLLEEYLPDDLETIHLYILTSSEHLRDVEKYEKIAWAKDYIVKPLTTEIIDQVILK